MTRTTRLLALSVALFPLLSACSTYHTGSHGADLGLATAAMVKRGMTRREVTALLGTPTNVTQGGEGREIWSYRFWMEWKGTKYVNHPIPPGTNRPNDGSVYVWFASDGRVARTYRDELPK